LYGKAADCWKRYAEQDDSNITVLTRLGDAYRKIGDFNRAKEIYQRSLRINPGNPFALNGLGHLHFDSQLYREAAAYWDELRAGEPQNIKILTALGNCYRRLKDFEKALEYFEPALKLDARNFYALFGIADCYRGLKNYRESLKAWETILDSDPRNKIILTRAGDVCRSLGELKKAEAYYRRALEAGFDTYAVLGLARIERIKGNPHQAVDLLTGLMSRDPTNRSVVTELAGCYEVIGDSQAAAHVTARYLERGDGNQNSAHDS
jgi:tetratricopeptide (TPR) repeat protein